MRKEISGKGLAVVRRIAIGKGGDDRLPVKDRSGATLFYVSSATARRMIDDQRVTPLGSKTVIRAVQVGFDFDDSTITTLAAYTGQRYSHRRETDFNPPNVWTLKRLAKADRPVFRRVVLDCIKAA